MDMAANAVAITAHKEAITAKMHPFEPNAKALENRAKIFFSFPDSSGHQMHTPYYSAKNKKEHTAAVSGLLRSNPRSGQ